MLEVVVNRPDGRSETLQYRKSSIMIGRASGNDICLEVTGVSRYHARLNIEGNKLFIQDLNSTNGSFLNSRRVETAEIQEGDKVSIGEVVLTARVLSEQSVVDAEDIVDSVDDNSMRGKPTDTFTRRRMATEQLVEDIEPEIEITPEPDLAIGADNFYWQSLRSFLAPIWTYIMDESVSEIMVNGPDEIFIESKGKLLQSDAIFTNDQLKAAVLNIAQYVGRRVSEEEPYLDARLPDGSRVAVLLPPCSRKGISIAIRKFSKEKLTLQKLLEFGSLSSEMIHYLHAAVVLKKNIIVSGGTSSGKTSLLNVVSSLIPSDERIITIEDSAELQLSQEHVLPMETKPPDKKGKGQITIRDLVKASLRMRPDRIIVGEIRGGEALDLLQAMNTGHSGSMATVHASSPRQALTRLETLSLFSGLDIPMRALREQVASAIDVVIQASRLADHSRKVTHITEVENLSESGEYQVTDIFRYVRTGTHQGQVFGSHVWTGAIPGLLEEMDLAGLTDIANFFRQGEVQSDSNVSVQGGDRFD